MPIKYTIPVSSLHYNYDLSYYLQNYKNDYKFVSIQLFEI